MSNAIKDIQKPSGEADDSNALVITRVGGDLTITLKETEAFAHPVMAELRKRLVKYPAAASFESIAHRSDGNYDVYPCDGDEQPLTGDIMLVEAFDVISKQGYILVSKSSDEKWLFMKNANM